MINKVHFLVKIEALVILYICLSCSGECRNVSVNDGHADPCPVTDSKIYLNVLTVFSVSL